LNVGVVDYGMGNLHSVAKALALSGARVRVTDSKKQLASSDLLVVPGVGSFGAAMVNLAKKKLDDFIRRWTAEKKPFLGICLGLQLLFERSEESPKVPGLGVMKGSVIRFRPSDFKTSAYQVPHMGWNNPVRQGSRGAAYFKNISNRDYVYFVHTYFPAPKDENVVLTRTPYGKNFCSAVVSDNLIATQFHPEKSGTVGLTLLKNVVRVMEKAA
jgi:imidazole glycerol phosphate synthase glutamine amidotransferase subunit